MSKQVETTGYAKALKNWPTKMAGPKVTKALIDQAHALGKRHGKECLALAMYLREGGATDGQVKAAVIAGWGSSGSHHNCRRDMLEAGFVRETAEGLADSEGHRVYAIALTAKGTAKINKATADKPAAKSKPKADKPAAVNEPVPGLPAEVQAPQATA